MTDPDEAVRRLESRYAEIVATDDIARVRRALFSPADLRTVLDALAGARAGVKSVGMYLRLEREAARQNLERAESAEAERAALQARVDGVLVYLDSHWLAPFQPGEAGYEISRRLSTPSKEESK